MGYSLHIERTEDEEPFTVEDWLAAIEGVDGVRLSSGDVAAVNPGTGERITIPNAGHDADVYFADSDEWVRVFSCNHEAYVSFSSGPLSSPSGKPAIRAAFALAEALDAEIVGDEGEPYEQADFG